MDYKAAAALAAAGIGCVCLGMKAPGPEPEPEPEPEPRQLPVNDAPVEGAPSAILGSVLPPALFAAVRSDFFRVVESDFEPPEKEDSFTFGTYWFSLRGDSGPPRNAIEAAALAISRTDAFRSLVDVDSLAGVEWWFQEQGDEDAAKDYHIDSDAHIVRGSDGANDVVLEKHPTLSSVFYLDDFGGGTAAFGQTKQPDTGKLVPRLPTSAVVSFPHPNQLFVFRGDLFHGVLATTERGPADAERSRFTLLYNWWSERPHGPCELPQEFAFGPPSVRSAVLTVAKRLSSITADGGCSFGQSSHLADWQSQQLPKGLAALERRTGSPLRVSYGVAADSELADSSLQDPDDWTETADQ